MHKVGILGRLDIAPCRHLLCVGKWDRVDHVAGSCQVLKVSQVSDSASNPNWSAWSTKFWESDFCGERWPSQSSWCKMQNVQYVWDAKMHWHAVHMLFICCSGCGIRCWNWPNDKFINSLNLKTEIFLQHLRLFDEFEGEPSVPWPCLLPLRSCEEGKGDFDTASLTFLGAALHGHQSGHQSQICTNAHCTNLYKVDEICTS